MVTMSLAVIIPTLNEAAVLPLTLAALQREPVAEIIIVDGGSSDRTANLAQEAGCRVVGASGKGRARQMNEGAAVATADNLLFLHADTRLPAGFVSLVERTLANHAVALGAFSLGIDDPGYCLRLVAWLANLRSRLFKLPYGDQAIFISTHRFKSAGGFPEIEIMEDFVFVRTMRRAGKIIIVPEQVSTSARRWRNLGVIRTTLMNQMIVCGFYAGVSPARLARWYRRMKGIGTAVDR